MKRTSELAEETWRSIFGQFASLPVCDRGKGVYLYDSEGKKYIDFSGGPMVVNIGHGNERVVRAMQEQARKLAFNIRFFWNNEPALLTTLSLHWTMLF